MKMLKGKIDSLFKIFGYQSNKNKQIDNKKIIKLKDEIKLNE